MQAQIVVVRGRVCPRISKDAIAMLPRARAPILIRARIVVEGLRSVDQLINRVNVLPRLSDLQH